MLNGKPPALFPSDRESASPSLPASAIAKSMPLAATNSCTGFSRSTAKSEDPPAGASMGLLEARQQRHLLDTRRTPGCPEVDQQRCAAPFGQARSRRRPASETADSRCPVAFGCALLRHQAAAAPATAATAPAQPAIHARRVMRERPASAVRPDRRAVRARAHRPATRRAGRRSRAHRGGASRAAPVRCSAPGCSARRPAGRAVRSASRPRSRCGRRSAPARPLSNHCSTAPGGRRCAASRCRARPRR